MKKTIILLLAASTCAMGTTLSDAVYSATGSSLSSSTSLSGVGSGSFTLTYTINVDKLFKNESFLIGETFNDASKTTFVSLSDVNNRHIGTAIGTSSSGNGPKPTQGVDDERTIYTRAFGIFQMCGTASKSRTFTDTKYYGGGTIAELSEQQMWKRENGNYITNDDGSYVMNTINVSNANSIIDNLVSITVTQSHTATSGSIMYMTLGMADGTTTEVFMDSKNTGLKWDAGYGNWKTLGVNTDVVSSVYLFNGAVDAATARVLNKAAAAAIPEPTTATLSLLALAGLAARRRRASR